MTLNWIGLAALSVMIVASPQRLVFDEPAQLGTVTAVDEVGWTKSLQETASSSGPLYPLVHFLFRPITKLHAPAVRYVNFLFIGASIYLTFAIARLLKLENPVNMALSLVTVPFVWPPLGLALTEAPALPFFALWIFLCVVFFARRLSVSGEICCSIGAGASLGLATLGRQTYLLSLAAALFSGRRSFRWLIYFVLQGVLVLCAVIWMYSLWGGIVPPSRSQFAGHVRFEHGLLSMGYVAIAFLILAPHWYWNRPMALYIIAGLAGLASVLFPIVQIEPAKTLVEHFLSPMWVSMYSALASGALIALAILWLELFLSKMWLERQNRGMLFIDAALLIVVLTPIAISHQFSSRYTATAAVLFPISLGRSIVSSKLTFFTSLIGTLIGAGTLATYYTQR